MLCYPRRDNAWKFSWAWLEWFSFWLCALDQWTWCLWLIHNHIRPPIWNAKGFDRELLLASFIRVATLTMTQVPFRRLDRLTRGLLSPHQQSRSTKVSFEIIISSDIQCLIAWFVGFLHSCGIALHCGPSYTVTNDWRSLESRNNTHSSINQQHPPL